MVRFPNCYNFTPGWNADLLGTIQINTAFFQFGQQIYSSHTEQNKRIPVDLDAEHIYYSGDMLARNRIIRTGALHSKITPLGRKNSDPKFTCHGKDLRIKNLVGKRGYYGRTFHKPIHKSGSVGG